MGHNMSGGAGLREEADAIARRLTQEQREALLVKCWMSHDARWFMAVARAYGMEAASRLNQEAAREEGKVEARRVTRALGMAEPRSVAEYLLAQEVLARVLVPDLTEYSVSATGADAFEFRIERCFAYENVTRAGVAEQYECGIFARVQGWLEGLGLGYEMTPPLGKCMKAQGRECIYAFRLGPPTPESQA